MEKNNCIQNKTQDIDSNDILHLGLLENLPNYRIFKLRYSKTPSLPTRYLTDWQLQTLPSLSNDKVCLVGVYENSLIRTSPVLDTIGRKKVFTANAIYILTGPQSKNVDQSYKHLNELFRNGFELSWRKKIANIGNELIKCSYDESPRVSADLNASEALYFEKNSDAKDLSCDENSIFKNQQLKFNENRNSPEKIPIILSEENQKANNKDYINCYSENHHDLVNKPFPNEHQDDTPSNQANEFISNKTDQLKYSSAAQSPSSPLLFNQKIEYEEKNIFNSFISKIGDFSKSRNVEPNELNPDLNLTNNSKQSELSVNNEVLSEDGICEFKDNFVPASHSSHCKKVNFKDSSIKEKLTDLQNLIFTKDNNFDKGHFKKKFTYCKRKQNLTADEIIKKAPFYKVKKILLNEDKSNGCGISKLINNEQLNIDLGFIETNDTKHNQRNSLGSDNFCSSKQECNLFERRSFNKSFDDLEVLIENDAANEINMNNKQANSCTAESFVSEMDHILSKFGEIDSIAAIEVEKNELFNNLEVGMKPLGRDQNLDKDTLFAKISILDNQSKVNDNKEPHEEFTEIFLNNVSDDNKSQIQNSSFSEIVNTDDLSEHKDDKLILSCSREIEEKNIVQNHEEYNLEKPNSIKEITGVNEDYKTEIELELSSDLTVSSSNDNSMLKSPKLFRNKRSKTSLLKSLTELNTNNINKTSNSRFDYAKNGVKTTRSVSLTTDNRSHGIETDDFNSQSTENHNLKRNDFSIKADDSNLTPSKFKRPSITIISKKSLKKNDSSDNEISSANSLDKRAEKQNFSRKKKNNCRYMPKKKRMTRK